MEASTLNKEYSTVLADVPTLSDKLTKAEESQLREQVISEYKAAYDHLIPKIITSTKRLKLYNNQRKNPESIGDNTLYSVMQTLMAQVYFDRINVKYTGIETGDRNDADNINLVAKYDYNKSKRYIIDYYWDWNTMFFGNNPLGLEGLDRKTLLPKYQLFDPLAFLRDPKAVMVDSIAGIPGLGYWGAMISISLDTIKKEPVYRDVSGLEFIGSFKDVDVSTLVAQAKMNRDIAQNRNPIMVNTGGDIDVLDWRTIFKGKRVRVNLAGHDMSRIIRFHYMVDGEGEDEQLWRLVTRQFSPMPMDWDGVTVPDFTEDKQRARARLWNLGLDNVEDTQRQSYLVNADAEVDKKALTNNSFNKYVSARGTLTNAIQPIQKQAIRSDLIDFIATTMEGIVERAAATPASQQGVQSGQQRTLGELELLTTGSMNRYKLFGSIFGWSERMHAELYYYILKNELQEGIDVKVLRLKGVAGTTERKLTKENIISLSDPDIEVQTLTESIQKKTIARQNKERFFQFAGQLPDADHKYMVENLGEEYDIDPAELSMMLPPNAFEYQAQDENEKLSKGEHVDINPDDDDDIHIKENSKATSNPASNAHIWAHKQQKMLKVTRPDLFPKLQQQQAAAQPAAPGAAGGAPNGQPVPPQGDQMSSNAMGSIKVNASPLQQPG